MKIPVHKPKQALCGSGDKQKAVYQCSLCAADHLKQLRGGVFCVYFPDDMCDYVVGIGNECGAHGSHIFLAGHFLFLPYAECLVDSGVFVAEEYEWQFIFCGETLVACRAVLADTYYRKTFAGQLFIAVAYGACLGCAP